MFKIRKLLSLSQGDKYKQNHYKIQLYSVCVILIIYIFNIDQ